MYKFIKITFILFTAVLLFSNCSKKNTMDTLPVATISNVTQERTISSSVFHFTVSLSKGSSNTVTIHYSTEDGTAMANTDFTAATGTLTFAANQQQGSVDITVKGDSLRRDDQLFYVKLDNPNNCTLQNNKATGTITNKDGLYFPVANTGYSTPLTYPGYTLVWNDEFSSVGLNAANWTFESGNNNGWGNNELEYYTDRTQNVFASNGNLIIEARAEQYNGFNYTSTRMITKNKKVFKFGRMDIRAKMPKGKGIWPALWMLGNNIDQVSWPACGEIDILELLGHEPNKIYATMHWGPTFAAHGSKGSSYVLSSGSFDQQFHVYSLVWTQDLIKVYVDDQLYVTVSSTEVPAGSYPFNNNFFFLFNVAVGGDWPGAPDNNTVFPQRMIVDYIRVFQ
jgi:beta-glucanase (GH16 family)